MSTKSNKINIMRDIVKSNPQVDISILTESAQFVDFIRKIGVNGPDFRILRSSEARLKMKPPVLQRFRD